MGRLLKGENLLNLIIAQEATRGEGINITKREIMKCKGENDALFVFKVDGGDHMQCTP